MPTLPSIDFHLHTFVSDGTLDPSAVLRHAGSRGLDHVAITDHDALGAYAWHDGEVFRVARGLGIELTVGIEMDTEFQGLEMHLLGLGLRLDDPDLNGHLQRVREARVERARREIGIVNGLLGEGTIREADIFVPERETLMKPHFIHPILEKGLFPTYEDANDWYRKNVKSGVSVPKPSLAEAIRLVHGAGGWTSLAHPGYYDRAGVAIVPALAALKDMGLDGIELDYPYHLCSPRQWSQADETAYRDTLRAAAEPLGLRFTRGSDSHTPDDFDRSYGRS